jgi:hypothetical protein
VVLELPAELRETLKQPLGPVFADVTAAIEQSTDTAVASRSSKSGSRSGGRVNVIAVGDVVTSDLLAAGRMPRAASSTAGPSDLLFPSRSRSDSRVPTSSANAGQKTRPER